MVDMGRVDGMVCGIGRSHPHVMRALLQVIPLRKDVRRVCGLCIILTKQDILFFADCTAKVDPTAEELAETALLSARVARNFGSVQHAETAKVRKAVDLVQAQDPTLVIDGEMQIDTALSGEIQEELFPFCELKGRANVLIFPNLAAGLIAAKLTPRIGNAEMIGPLTIGLSKPVNVLHLAAQVDDVVNAAAITVIECVAGML